MKLISRMIFRRLSSADFYNINKKPVKGAAGGGQSYIDVPTANVSLQNWTEFLDTLEKLGEDEKPYWDVVIHSVGAEGTQTVRIGLRRSSSVNIRSQKLHSQQSNRIRAWHPDFTHFPQAPPQMTGANDSNVSAICEGLTVIIARTIDREYWALWLNRESIVKLASLRSEFASMLEHSAGLIDFKNPIPLNTKDAVSPFKVDHGESEKIRKSSSDKQHKPYNPVAVKSEIELAEALFKDDLCVPRSKMTESTKSVYRRNMNVSKKLKQLYRKCQISGLKYVFPKANGDPYLEVHHLIPLGEGGADHPANLIVVSAHIHKMLHFGDVSGIDLSNIRDGKLDIQINGNDYQIEWIADHERLVKNSVE